MSTIALLVCDERTIFFFPAWQVGHGNAKSNLAEGLATALCTRQPHLTVSLSCASYPGGLLLPPSLTPDRRRYT